MTTRNLRRGWYFIDAAERDHSWQDVVVRLSLAGTTLAALAVDLTLGPLASIPVCACISPVVRITRMRAKATPGAERLRIPPPAREADEGP